MRIRTIIVAAACTALVAIVGAVRPAAHATSQGRTDGEFGLSVRYAADSMVVQWLTRDSAAGLLRASAPQRLVRIVTPPGFVHRAAFRMSMAETVTLQYGSVNDSVTGNTRIAGGIPARPSVTPVAGDSIYFVGDTHGNVDALVVGLRAAGLIDTSLRWTGGKRQLVFAGDLTDRGPDVTRLLWLVYRLEAEAARAGGAVHVVLGNHEVMVWFNDVRYVHPKELALARAHGINYFRLFDSRLSVLGRWLASKPAMMRIGPILVAHGGVAPEYANYGLRAFDDTLAAYTREDLFYLLGDSTAVIRMDSATANTRLRFFESARSVFWHRAYVDSDSVGAELDAVLRKLDATIHVVGHTPVASIGSRYDNKLIAVHTSRYGAELLLIVRDGAAYRRFRITPGQPPQPF